MKKHLTIISSSGTLSVLDVDDVSENTYREKALKGGFCTGTSDHIRPSQAEALGGFCLLKTGGFSDILPTRVAGGDRDCVGPSVKVNGMGDYPAHAEKNSRNTGAILSPARLGQAICWFTLRPRRIQATVKGYTGTNKAPQQWGALLWLLASRNALQSK
jgi:hypothetical protein